MNTAPKFELAFAYRRGAVLSREDRTTRKSQTQRQRHNGRFLGVQA